MDKLISHSVMPEERSEFRHLAALTPEQVRGDKVVSVESQTIGLGLNVN